MGFTAGGTTRDSYRYIVNLSEASLYTAVQTLSSKAATGGPISGGSITINSQSLGSRFGYTIYSGNQTISSYSNSDWFNPNNDEPAFIIVNGNLTIDSGQTVIPSQRKLFTCIYVTGDLAVNGSISMSSRGANHGAGDVATTAVAIRIVTGTYNGISNPEVPAAGGGGGGGRTVTNGGGGLTGTAGTAGSAGGTGGGGGGGAHASNAGNDATSGAGVAGTSFSGGSGGGGCRIHNGDATSSPGVTNGGAGGAGNGSENYGGGAGNPGGAGIVAGSTGTGGVLIIIVGGAFTGSGSLTAAGATGGSTVGAGGGSGGGSVTVLYAASNTLTSWSASGGAGGVSGNSASGGAGGAGSVRGAKLAADANGGNDSYVKLLMHCDGTDASTTFTDSSASARTLTAQGNAQIDTAQSVYSGASLLCDGTGDRVSMASSTDFDFGAGDFTIDARIRLNATTGYDCIISNSWDQAASQSWFFGYNNTTIGLLFYSTGAGNIESNSTISLNTWYHVAVVREGGIIRLFKDGTQVGSSTVFTGTIAAGTASILVGGSGDSSGDGNFFNGWIEELRVSKGIARWNANFTPPSSAYA